MTNNISVNIISSKERGSQKLLVGTISWLEKTLDYIGEENIGEVLIACEKLDEKLTNKTLEPIKERGIKTRVITSNNVYNASTRNKLMKMSSGNVIMFLDPNILIGYHSRLLIKDLIYNFDSYSSNTVLLTRSIKMGMIDLDKNFATLHPINTSRLIHLKEDISMTILQQHPLLFFNLYPTIKWINYNHPTLKSKSLSKYLPKKIFKYINHLDTNRQLLHNDEDPINGILCSLSIDVSRISSNFTYVEDYLSYNTTLLPYTKSYRDIRIVNTPHGKLRYPNPIEMMDVITKYFYGSESFFHYFDYPTYFHKSQDLNRDTWLQHKKFETEIKPKPKIHDYSDDVIPHDFPIDGEKSIFKEREPKTLELTKSGFDRFGRPISKDVIK